MRYRVFILVLTLLSLILTVKESSAGFIKKDAWEEQHVTFDCKYKFVADRLLSLGVGAGTTKNILRKDSCNSAGDTLRNFYLNAPLSLDREELEKFRDKFFKKSYTINAAQFCHALIDLAYNLRYTSLRDNFNLDDTAKFYSKAIFLLYLTDDLNLDKTMQTLSVFANRGGITYLGYYPWALNLAILFLKQENPHTVAVEAAIAILSQDIPKIKELIKEVEKAGLYREACIDLYY